MTMSSTPTQLATFGSGCFWCGQALFKQLRGILSVTVGYAGGTTTSPSYEEVCNGTTHHAEVFQIEFDPSQITYQQLVEVFFLTHDPTSLNRQGHDVGEQYRSVIFTHSDDQAVCAKKTIQQLTNDHVFDRPIVTDVQPFPTFYPAEQYHQDYFTKNPEAAYCQAVINPKLTKFKQHFAQLLR